jgi:putrescine transport system substrate-binding protein
VPTDAPARENALRFIDYLRPALISVITAAVSSPNANLPATARVKPEIRDDPAVYPPENVRCRCYVAIPARPDYERARTRLWTRLKSGR